MIRAILAAALLALLGSPAFAQSSPGWGYKFQPTPAEWNAAFSVKQDLLGYTAVNRNGDTMTGKLVTTPSTSSSSGFNLPEGTAPGSPNNGDVWTTTLGLFVRIEGVTYGPLSATTGTVTSVGLTAPAQFSVSGSPITAGAGTLALSWANQNANIVFAGPSTGSAAAPTFRALVGADLPNPAASTLGGVKSLASVSHQWLNSIGTNGTPTQTQPAFTDISGTATITQGGTGQGTAAAAINALLPTQTSQAGKALETDGTNPSWVTVPGTGTVTSVAVGTGLTGGPITITGTVSLAAANANTIKGNNTGSSAAPVDLTAVQTTTMLNSLGSGSLSAGGFRNLIVTATGNTTATITADAIVVVDSSGEGINLNSVSLTNTNSGTGANGLDTGTIATSTWYNLFVIYNATTTTKASLLSLSATAPTLPSGYAYALRVGAVRNAASGGYLRSIQYGRRAQIVVGTNPTTAIVLGSSNVGSITVPTWVSLSVSSFVPPTAASIRVYANNVNNGGIIVAPNSNYGAAGSTTNLPPLAYNGTNFPGNLSVPADIVLESTNLSWANSNCQLFMSGWDDNL